VVAKRCATALCSFCLQTIPTVDRVYPDARLNPPDWFSPLSICYCGAVSHTLVSGLVGWPAASYIVLSHWISSSVIPGNPAFSMVGQLAISYRLVHESCQCRDYVLRS
jgi:hypothetical protein